MVQASKNTYYTICNVCGANLDPGEKCDCLEEKPIKVKAKGRGNKWDLQALRTA